MSGNHSWFDDYDLSQKFVIDFGHHSIFGVGTLEISIAHTLTPLAPSDAYLSRGFESGHLADPDTFNFSTNTCIPILLTPSLAMQKRWPGHLTSMYLRDFDFTVLEAFRWKLKRKRLEIFTASLQPHITPSKIRAWALAFFFSLFIPFLLYLHVRFLFIFWHSACGSFHLSLFHQKSTAVAVVVPDRRVLPAFSLLSLDNDPACTL